MNWAGRVTATLLAQPGKKWRLRAATEIQYVPLPSSFVMFANLYMGELLRAQLLSAWQAGYAHRHWRTVPIVLFRSEEYAEDGPSDLGWKELSPNLRVVEVHGVHATMLHTPYVSELRSCFIDEATGRSNVSESLCRIDALDQANDRHGLVPWHLKPQILSNPSPAAPVR
jgi:hypothetical protein